MANRRVKHRKNKNNANLIRLIIVLGIILIILTVVLIAGIIIKHVSGDDDEYVTGVDVCQFQKEIDWQGLASEDIHFAYIKATEGSSHIDPNFEVNWEGACEAMDRVGAYHFLSYDSPGDTQADNFIANIPKNRHMLPPAIDVEFYGKYKKEKNYPTQEQVDSVLQVLLDRLEDKYKMKPVIYTNNFIYDTYISGKYDEYPIWISDPNIPEKLSDDRDWTFCQYTFRNKSQYVANGEKYLDMNVFHGGLSKLRKYKGD